MRFMITFMAVMMPAISWASCGPVVEFYAETDREYEYGNSLSGYDIPIEKWNNDRNRGHKIGFELSIPLNDIECRVEEADRQKRLAEARDKRADAMDQRLRNFQRILDICEQDENLPICVKLPIMSAELGLE